MVAGAAEAATSLGARREAPFLPGSDTIDQDGRLLSGMIRWMFLLALCAAPLAAQPKPADKSLGTWDLEYDRSITRPHAEPQIVKERTRVTLRLVGDSVLGDLSLMVGDSASGGRYVARGTATAGRWSFYSEEPRPTGFAVLLVPVEAAMDWMKETIHGAQPRAVRFDLTAQGDSVTGTRTVTGGFPGSAPRVSPVTGKRRP